jgi:predicted alpha/beta hydrolase
LPLTSPLPTPAEPRELPVTTTDGARSVLTLFEAGSDAPLALVLPAMGIEARYYDRFARALCGEGVSAAFCDLRGAGRSSVRAGRGQDFGYGAIATRDVAAVRAVLEREGKRRVFLVGHSLGGQLALLHAAAAPEPPAGIALVAASSPHFVGYRGRVALRVLFGTQAARLVAEAMGYFPGNRLGFGGREARTLIREWSRVARTGRYRLGDYPGDPEARLRELVLPVLSITLEGDEIAPPEAADLLLAKVPRADVARFHYVPAEHGLLPTGHNRWPREPAVIARSIARWMLAHRGD